MGEPKTHHDITSTFQTCNQLSSFGFSDHPNTQEKHSIAPFSKLLPSTMILHCTHIRYCTRLATLEARGCVDVVRRSSSLRVLEFRAKFYPQL